jgi:hypothetical protein
MRSRKGYRHDTQCDMDLFTNELRSNVYILDYSMTDLPEEFSSLQHCKPLVMPPDYNSHICHVLI